MRESVEGDEKEVEDFREKKEIIEVEGRIIRNNEMGRMKEKIKKKREEKVRMKESINVMKEEKKERVVEGKLKEEMR